MGFVAAQRGAAWLSADTHSAEVLTPEKLSAEHRLIAQTAAEFVRTEVQPRLDELERKDWTVARRLIAQAGERGLIGADVPEAHGGVGLDKAAAIVVADQLGLPASFAATFGGQANLSVLPLVLFGTDDQKARYLPRLVSGELVGAYALSESGSGSDALGARALARRDTDGTYVLNGEKLWITNGGFADLFIVFAKIDGEHFTAFLVERAFPGVTTGSEENKMGLHGSSTTPLVLSDARVPGTNVLGEPGKGHKVAFNVLNYGRLKLGAMCAGGARQAIGEAARYSRDRRQFGQPIASFGAIKHKLGEMTARTYALESLLYRTAGLLDGFIGAAEHDGQRDGVLAALEEFAVEASIAKVGGSETLDFVFDENIQIHGGNGFVRDYPAERYYRDSRVNRIFEGTNEINRLLIPTLVARRATRREQGPKASQTTRADALLRAADEVPSELDAERTTLAGARTATSRVLALATDRYRDALGGEQEILSFIADMMIDLYSSESALLRAHEAERLALADRELHVAAARLFAADAARRIASSGIQAIAATCPDAERDAEAERVRTTICSRPINTVELRRILADETVARGSYLFPLEREP
jgi:alkylation response protein AidB-like acyl-CoA dehydrogenase